MNATTTIRARSLPPVTLSVLRAAGRRAVAEREQREAKAMQEARVVLTRLIERKPKSPATENLEAANRRLSNRQSDATARTVTRASRRLSVMNDFPADQREAARALYRIIDR